MTEVLLPADEPVALDAMRWRLAARAEAEDLLEVAYRVVDSPLGPLLLASTRTGLATVGFPDPGPDRLLQSLSDRLGSRVLESPARLDPVARQLEEYFAGRRSTFDLPLDLCLSGGFRRVVLRRLAEVPYGRTTTYAALAAAAGSPRAVRAVGTACATNPLPIVIGCHRVLRSDGGLGDYAGGLAAKRLLLELEAQGR